MNRFIKKKLLFFFPIRLISRKFNPIILYHSLGSNPNFNKNIDHVNLQTLENQLRAVQEYWNFVKIDEYIKAKNKKRLACLTIDDGYKNVLEESLEIFEKLEIPITIFVNSSTFRGKIFWRDKVRYLIEKRLVNQFIEESLIFNKKHLDIFYSISKNPKFNSIEVEKEIDKFFLKKNLDTNFGDSNCFDDKKYLINHPLISYGNHSANHYVMSSLNKDQQLNEILECKNFLDEFHVNKSNVFCIPFGGKDSFNEQTISILNKLNYKYILLSENKLNKIRNNNQIERFMPKNFDIIETIKTLYLKNYYN
ncbi:polysaccharide deacetylase family protein [Candidatus Pelagibacter sp.]|nr:polysaccharide deacetylase family protein [Candidatus Pelagibacter sp.]